MTAYENSYFTSHTESGFGWAAALVSGVDEEELADASADPSADASAA